MVLAKQLWHLRKMSAYYYFLGQPRNYINGCRYVASNVTVEDLIQKAVNVEKQKGQEPNSQKQSFFKNLDKEQDSSFDSKIDNDGQNQKPRNVSAPKSYEQITFNQAFKQKYQSPNQDEAAPQQDVKTEQTDEAMENLLSYKKKPYRDMQDRGEQKAYQEQQKMYGDDESDLSAFDPVSGVHVLRWWKEQVDKHGRPKKDFMTVWNQIYESRKKWDANIDNYIGPDGKPTQVDRFDAWTMRLLGVPAEEIPGYRAVIPESAKFIIKRDANGQMQAYEGDGVTIAKDYKPANRYQNYAKSTTYDRTKYNQQEEKEYQMQSLQAAQKRNNSKKSLQQDEKIDKS